MANFIYIIYLIAHNGCKRRNRIINAPLIALHFVLLILRVPNDLLTIAHANKSVSNTNKDKLSKINNDIDKHRFRTNNG